MKKRQMGEKAINLFEKMIKEVRIVVDSFSRQIVDLLPLYENILLFYASPKIAFLVNDSIVLIKPLALLCITYRYFYFYNFLCPDHMVTFHYCENR